jgi:hypothetical protein
VVERCLEDALHVIRFAEEEEIGCAKMYVYRNRESAELPKDPERLLKVWDEIVEKSKFPVA